MKTKITQNDLLRFIYRETTDPENDLILSTLENDWILKEQLETLLLNYSLLEQAKLQPNKNCVNEILKYSRESAKSKLIHVP